MAEEITLPKNYETMSREDLVAHCQIYSLKIKEMAERIARYERLSESQALIRSFFHGGHRAARTAKRVKMCR